MAGSRRALWGLAVLSIAGLALPSGPVRADDASCQDFRAKIIDMDAKSSKLPGYIQLRAELGSLYGKLCSVSTPAQAQEYWYSLDGKKLGPAGGERPDKAAYATTEEIGRACATAINPSMCALTRGAFSLCANPPDAETKAGCNVLGAYPTSGEAQPQPGQAPPLPSVNVTLDGQTFALPADCYNVLAAVIDDPPANRLKPAKGLRYKILDSERLEMLRDACPDFLAALERRLGGAEQSPSRFWPGLHQLASASFAPGGAAPGAIPSMPPAICQEAEKNMNTCKARWENMGPVGSPSRSRSGQAGAFADCYLLYQNVVGMCRLSNPASVRSSPPAQASAASPQPSRPPADGSGHSAPPPAQQSGLSPQCQSLVSTYVAAAQANDGPRALAGYNALKQAGGCGVLAKVDRPLPATGAPAVDDPRFQSRSARPLSDQVLGACDQSPEACAARVQQLKTGTSPEAVAALYTNAIGIGLQLGSMMGNAVSMGVPAGGSAVGGGGTNMNSIGNRPVRSTYGQGHPNGPAPPQSQSTITGTK